MNEQVVLFLPSVETGGVERNAVYFANGMVKKGFSVHLLYCRKEDAWFSRFDERVRRIKVPRWITIPLVHERLIDALNILLFAFIPLRKVQRRGRTAIVSFQSNVVAIALACVCHIPIAVRLSNHFGAADHEDSRLRKLSEFAKRITYQFSDQVIANSSELAKDYALVLGREVLAIPNPVDFPNIQRLRGAEVLEPQFLHRNRPIIISAGRLAPQKNYPLLLQAMSLIVKEVPCDLIILGEGAERASLEALIRDLGLDEFVHLLGYRDNVYKYFRHSDLFVLSSNYEGMPNVLIEAIACGLPAVATRCKTGPAEILCNGDGGDLVPVGDAQALANAVVRALKEPSLTNQRQLNAAANITRYSLEIIEDQYACLTNELLITDARI